MFQNYTRNKCQTVNNALGLILKRPLLDHSLKWEMLRPLPGHTRSAWPRCGETSLQVAATRPPSDSPDEQQDEGVQAPLHGSQSHAPDAHQLVGLVLAESCSTAAERHGAAGQRREEALTHSFTLSSSFFLWGRSHGRTPAAAVNISHPHTRACTSNEISMQKKKSVQSRVVHPTNAWSLQMGHRW